MQNETFGRNLNDKLKDLASLREAQDCVITLRTEVPSIYGKYLKRESQSYVKKLVNGQLKVDTTMVQVPELEPPQNTEFETRPPVSYAELSEHAKSIKKCLQFYRK